MQGYQAISTKLRTADGQHPGLQIDVFKPEVTRFAETYAHSGHDGHLIR
jgi:hypothetical protein